MLLNHKTFKDQVISNILKYVENSKYHYIFSPHPSKGEEEISLNFEEMDAGMYKVSYYVEILGWIHLPAVVKLIINDKEQCVTHINCERNDTWKSVQGFTIVELQSPSTGKLDFINTLSSRNIRIVLVKLD